jgi:hypothetical protein
MARRSVCETISEMVMRDYRLLSLPPLTRLLWHNLLMAMRFGGVSVLRSGGRPLDANTIATLAAISVSEVDANVDLLVACGLLVREEDGALGSPLLAAVVSRSEINRANALAGAAKRRLKASVPGQRELPITQVVGGTDVDGADSVSETGERTRPGAPTTTNLVEVKSKKVVSSEVYARAVQAAMAAAGFDETKWTGDRGIIRQWVVDGATPEMIDAVIRAKMHPGVTTFRYFTGAIGDALKRSVAVTDDLPASSRAFTEATQTWFRSGRIGPQPRPEDFRPGGKHAVAA